MCVFDVFNCKYCVCRLYILHVVQPADITLQGFLFAAQFLTVNSGGRFFNRTPSVLLSSTSERPSTAKTTQHPDPSIDPQVDPSHPSPHPSFPLCSSDLMSRSKYWSASGPSLLRSPSPPSPHGFVRQDFERVPKHRVSFDMRYSMGFAKSHSLKCLLHKSAQQESQLVWIV